MNAARFPYTVKLFLHDILWPVPEKVLRTHWSNCEIIALWSKKFIYRMTIGVWGLQFSPHTIPKASVKHRGGKIPGWRAHDTLRWNSDPIWLFFMCRVIINIKYLFWLIEFYFKILRIKVRVGVACDDSFGGNHRARHARIAISKHQSYENLRIMEARLRAPLKPPSIILACYSRGFRVSYLIGPA